MSEKELKQKEDDVPPHVGWRHRKRHCASWHSTMGKPTVIVKDLGNSGAGTFSRGTPSDSALKCGVKLAAVFVYAANRRASLRRLGDVAIDAACHLVAGAVPHVFMLSRLVPQLRLSTA